MHYISLIIELFLSTLVFTVLLIALSVSLNTVDTKLKTESIGFSLVVCYLLFLLNF